MAFVSGTATNYRNLLSLLRTFALAQGWTESRYVTGAEDELILVGPGSGADNIRVGMKTYSNGVGQYYNWKLGGFTGYLAGNPFESQPGYSGESPSPVSLALWNSSIPYWFVIDNFRIIVVAKVNNTYQCAYLGFMRTFGSPGQYPYPLVVGGSHSFIAAPPDVTSGDWRYDSAFFAFNFYAYPSFATGPRVGVSSCRVRTPTGTWRSVSTRGSSFQNGEFGNIDPASQASNLAQFDALADSQSQFTTVFPWCSSPDGVDPNLDGTAPMIQGEIITGEESGDGNDILGELRGVFWTTGRLAAAEDILEIGTDDYLVIANGGGGSTLQHELAAIALI